MIGRLRSSLIGLRRVVADRVLGHGGPARAAPARRARAPFLVVTAARRGAGGYYPEILRAEGFTASEVIASADLDRTALADRAVVLVADPDLAGTAPALLAEHVEAGGCLVALRPSAGLAPVLGLARLDGSIDDPYLAVSGATAATEGIVTTPLQIHGPADRWAIVDAIEVAALVDRDGRPLGGPAVTQRDVGERGGRAIAFTYDLARSVVLTRQGNPEWAGQNRDGDLLVRASEMFFGSAVDDPRPDWVDRSLLSIPQADEQQRLLVNLIVDAAASASRPLPRFWYLPHGHRAAVVMTGDDHGTGGTAARFDRYRSLDRPGASAADWECVRATSYVFPRTRIPWRKLVEFNRRGFEVALHVNTLSNDWTPEQLRGFYARQIPWFRNRLAFAGAPVTHRTHCVTWSDYDTQARVELEHGIRFDTNYYLYPPRWARGGAGHFTGSGLPMRFADRTGEPIDVYQAVTQISDEAEQELPRAFDELLDGALGPDGFVTVVTVNAHTDFADSGVSDTVVASAQDRGVPVVSAKQMLTWLDARNGSWVEAPELAGDRLRFGIRSHPDARGLQVLVPADVAGRSATAVRRDGRPLPLDVAVVKGVRHLRVEARDGSYEVDYAPTPARGGSEPAAQGAGAPPGEVIPVDLDRGELHQLTRRPVVGGELVLAPALHAGFDDEEVPPGWEAAGRWRARGDRASLESGSLASIKDLRPYALEGMASFSHEGTQTLGFAAPTGERAAFEAGVGGRLEAVVWREGRRVSVPIPGSWADDAHRYRIDVEPSGSIRFWIDHSDVALIEANLPDRVKVVAESAGGDGAALDVQWLSALPHAPEGSWTAPVVDVGRADRRIRLRWTAVYQQGTVIRAEVRRGDAAAPDERWTAWTPLAAPNRPVPGTGRHVQCRLLFSGAYGYKTPSLRSLEVVLEE